MAVAAVQDPPFARPQSEFVPQTFATHWFAAPQEAPLFAAQVFVVALQAPVV